MSLINDLLKSTNNDLASVVEDGVIADLTGHIDTGAYAFNALVSGSIYNGFPRNRITALAGDPSVGKTYTALSCVKSFFDDNPTGIVFYFDSESALTKDMCAARGIPTKQMVILPVATIEQVRKQIFDLLTKYKESKDKTRLAIFVDSLGMLSTTKEMTDVGEGKETRDMTRAQVIKSAFRILTIMSADCDVPIIITNHVYSSIGYITTKVQSGGVGIQYAASTIIHMSKKQDKDADGVIGGVFLTCKLEKSRFTREKQSVELRLSFETGLDKYYGLLPIAEKYEIIKKDGKKYLLPDGRSVWGKEIHENPEAVYTKDILDQIDAVCKKEFCFGSDANLGNDDKE